MKGTAAHALLLACAAVLGAQSGGGAAGAGGALGAERTPLLVLAYRDSDSWESREQILRRIAQTATQPPADFYPTALREAVAARATRMIGREEAARAAVKLELVRRLGLTKAVASAADVFRLCGEEKSFALRGACLEALGRMGAREYGAAIAEELRRLSAKPEGGVEGEALALGAIAGLEALSDPAGYASVFYASFGNVPAAVRARAAEALPRIALDPTEALQAIVTSDPLLVVRLEAITVQSRSGAAAAKKIATAGAALAVLAGRKQASVEDVGFVTRIRSVAAQALIDNGAHDDALLPLLDGVVRDEPDLNARLAAIQAIGVVGTDKAAALLTAHLARLNDRQKAGDRLDDRVVRATIRAAGAAGKAIAREQLLRVRFAGYASGVVREAERALTQIP